MSCLRIVFAGTPEFALPALDALQASPHELIAVYTQPDRPAGRGRKLQPSAVKSWAVNHQIPVHQPLHFKDPLELEILQQLNADVMVVIAYGLILPKSVLNAPKLGCINVHASLLPRWRGASPIQQAILAGDSTTGVTIMQMDQGMDTGDMLRVVPLKIDAKDTSASLQDKLSQLAATPLLETLHDLSLGLAVACPQPSEGVTYAPKIKKEDARINWQQSAAIIDRQIRGHYPWPIATTVIHQEVVRIHSAQVLQEQSTAPAGSLLGLSQQGLRVNTGEGIVCITSLQFPGGKPLAPIQLAQRFQLGDCLP